MTGEPEFVDAQDDVGLGEGAVEARRALEREEIRVRNQVKEVCAEEMKNTVMKMKNDIIQEVTEIQNHVAVLDPTTGEVATNAEAKAVMNQVKEMCAEQMKDTVLKMKNDIIQEVVEKQS